MKRLNRSTEKVKGVMTAVAKRGVFFLLAILIFQMLSVQASVNQSDNRQQAQNEAALEKALDENQKEHAKTQRFVRCLVGIVLRPLADRPDDPQQALSSCGEGKAAAAASADRAESAQSTASATPLAQGNTARTLQVTTGSPPDSTTSPTLQPSPAPASESPASPSPLVDLRPLLRGAYGTAQSVPVLGDAL